MFFQVFHFLAAFNKDLLILVLSPLEYSIPLFFFNCPHNRKKDFKSFKERINLCTFLEKVSVAYFLEGLANYFDAIN